MGGLRAGAEIHSPAKATSAGSAESESLPGGRERRATLAAYLLAGVALFTVYPRLSETYTVNSDSANILLMAWDLLHGHLWMSNVSWYSPKLHYANFIVLDSRAGFMNHWEPRALILNSVPR